MNWKEVLENISVTVNKRIDLNSIYYDKSEIENDWLGYPPCSNQNIIQKEKELGITLPVSYRDFLLTSNGFKQISLFAGHLLPLNEIGKLEEKEKFIYDLYKYELDSHEVSDKDYFNYENQNSVNFRVEYLLESIVISKNVDGVIILLNPNIKFEKEWEAWTFGNWYPGAHRYKSFKELILDEINTTIELLDEEE